MSSLEGFYQELDARMALPDNEDWHELSSRRHKASHRYSVFPARFSSGSHHHTNRTSRATPLSNDDDSIALPMATMSPLLFTNEIGSMYMRLLMPIRTR